MGKSDSKPAHPKELDLDFAENIAALDIGFSKTRRTSGVGLLHSELDMHRVCGADAATALILKKSPLSIIAIDGPIIPEGQSSKLVRLVEGAFCRGIFQRRCKPGMSHIPGTGDQLRYEAGKAADNLSLAAPIRSNIGNFPRVRNGAIVEAFPNAFLGVCLDDDVYASMPKLRRGKKFDWLYDQWVRHQHVETMKCLTDLEQTRFQGWLQGTKNHEERAALICVLTALLTARGHFTAVGDKFGGWFFLPPIYVWASWAKSAINEIVAKSNLESGNGLCIIQGDGPMSISDKSASAD